MAKKKKDDTRNISFRLTNEAVAAELRRQAEASAAESPSLYVRQLLTEALTRPDSDRQATESIQNQLAEIRHDIQELRDDLSSAVNLLLVKAGQLTEDQARAWCEKTLVSHE